MTRGLFHTSPIMSCSNFYLNLYAKLVRIDTINNIITLFCGGGGYLYFCVDSEDITETHTPRYKHPDFRSLTILSLQLSLNNLVNSFCRIQLGFV